MRLLIGTDSDYTAVIRAANEMHGADERSPLIVLLGGTDSFSFRPRPSTILVPHMPAGVIAAVPALEEFGIASRLASTGGLPGCYDGTVLGLAEEWLQAVEPSLRAQMSITVVGADEFVRSTQELGQRVGLPVRTVAA